MAVLLGHTACSMDLAPCTQNHRQGSGAMSHNQGDALIPEMFLRSRILPPIWAVQLEISSSSSRKVSINASGLSKTISITSWFKPGQK